MNATIRYIVAGLCGQDRRALRQSALFFAPLLLVGAYACSDSSSAEEQVGQSEAGLSYLAYSGIVRVTERTDSSITLTNGAGSVSQGAGGATFVLTSRAFTLKVYKQPDHAPLVMYDASYRTDIGRGSVWLPTAQYDLFASQANTNSSLNVSMRYDSVGSFIRGVTQFCFQNYCFTPPTYPNDLTHDMSLAGTSCLQSNGSVVGSLRDDADDGTLMCLTPWDPMFGIQ